MRVIAGSARRLVLKTAEGLDTRPTTDRIKETLFNMLQNELYGCRFLDLFAGSGAIGIEALSRGAGRAVFIDNGRRQIACIRENLETTHLSDNALVLAFDVLEGLGRLEKTEACFDLVFMDPPYLKNHEKQVLSYFRESVLADRETVFIVEAALETDFSWAEEMGYQIIKNKKYKTNQHVFLKKRIHKEQNERGC
ncbi:MAG: 16S rRNA (guanine(966)-N(2))-methyltransferase RsmD [Lachnospiraceae bacterium]|nr:16S rRNA (guanine(966)-N(2))-methyltransferase RsmD [Lachnospiraceae bacterium]